MDTKTQAGLDALRPRFDAIYAVFNQRDDVPVELAKTVQLGGRALNSMWGCLARGRGPEVLGAAWTQYEAQLTTALVQGEEWVASVS